MPIFEYQCKSCGKIFEKLTFNRTKVQECPSCKSGNTEKKLSVFSGIVSGSDKSCPAKSACESTGHTCGSCCPMHH